MTTGNNNLDEHNLEQDKTEVFDEVDMASHLALSYTENALKMHREKNKKKTLSPDFDGVTCVECGDDLPQVRIEMGVDLCTSCQTDIEEREKLIKRR